MYAMPISKLFCVVDLFLVPSPWANKDLMHDAWCLQYPWNTGPALLVHKYSLDHTEYIHLSNWK